MMAIIAAHAQTSLYWDIKNGSGSGGPTPSGTWDTTTGNWNTTTSGSGSAGLWSNGSTAVFSAGTDATGLYTVTIAAGGVSAAGLVAEEGTPTLAGGTLTLTGSGVDVAASRTLTISSVIAGSVGLNKTNAGILVLSGANTYSGVTTVTGGTLQAGANLNFSGGLDLAAGTTLDLNGKSVAVGTLNINGSSVIDFSSGASSLSVGTLNIASGATLTINGWTDMVDYLMVGSFAGATVEVRGSGTASQVVFSGKTGADTLWTRYGEVTPVPEPSAYGALFLTLMTGGYAWRRRRQRALKTLSRA